MRTLLRLVVTLVIVVAPAALLAVQDQGFKPASEVPREVLPATPLVFGAYAFCWAALLVYVFMLWRRLGRVERDLAEVGARTRTRA